MIRLTDLQQQQQYLVHRYRTGDTVITEVWQAGDGKDDTWDCIYRYHQYDNGAGFASPPSNFPSRKHGLHQLLTHVNIVPPSANGAVLEASFISKEDAVQIMVEQAM